MDSPAKRRKTSATTGIPVAPELAKIQARRPRRPSYQSPTRASLARSNPDVLERALSRSPTRRPISKGDMQQDPQMGGLRNRKALRPSLNTASPFAKPRQSEVPESSPNRRASGIQALSKPPRRMSKRILPGDLVFGSPLPPPTNTQSNTPEGQLAMELGNATRDEDIDLGPDEQTDEDMLEPDLPPTPTQLGLEKAPDRGFSNSPSMRLEKRSKRRISNQLNQSPLKAVNFQSMPPEDAEGAEIDSHLSVYSAAVHERQISRKKFAADLRRLKQEVEELEGWAKKVETNSDLKADTKSLNKFLSLLASEEANRTTLSVPQTAPKPISSLLATLLPFSASINRPKRHASPLPTNPYALRESSQALPYLTAFAPLELRTRTTRSSHRGELSETHSLNFTPPSPFPPNLYNVVVTYETTPETQCLTSLSVATGRDSKKRKVPEVLRRWIDSRLENPLLKLDVATLCWGINRYWESTVARARLWAYIDQRYGPRALQNGKTMQPANEDGTITIAEIRKLVPHLDRSSMVIKPKPSASRPRVMISNSLLLDEWTGEPQLQPEITVSVAGVHKRIDQETKKLFHTLLHEDPGLVRGVEGSVHVDAILRATEGALSALIGRL